MVHRGRDGGTPSALTPPRGVANETNKAQSPTRNEHTVSRSKFQDEIRSELDAIIEEMSLESYPTNYQNGKAFELWSLDLLGQWNTDLDVDAHNLPDSGDGGVDILLEESSSSADRFLIAQCAYVGKNGRFNIDKWQRLCQLANDLLDEERILKGGYGTGQETQEALARVARRIEETEASVDLFYITTASAPDAHHDSARTLSKKLGSRGLNVHLWDNSELRRLRSDAASIEAQAIEEVTLDVPTDQHFVVDCGSSTAHVLVLKASTASQYFDKYQQRLLAWNIRSYLGSNSINSAIRVSAEDRADEFFLCNNGITAIARKVTPSGSGKHIKLVCEKIQVINGGQTLASLNEVRKQPSKRDQLANIPVLFTVIETKETSPTSPFNQRLIQARNTQNKVHLSDFRSNDPIQLWLEKNLEREAASLLPRKGLGSLEKCRKLFYKPKRDFRRKKGYLKLQLEDLAKIRYAFLHDPWTVLAYVNQLWTKRGEETKDHPGKRSKGRHSAAGKYEKAFGRAGVDADNWVLPKTWTSAEAVQCVFAVVVHEHLNHRINELLREIKQKEKSGVALTSNEASQKSYLKRARFHMIALAGEHYGQLSPKALKKLMGDADDLISALDKHWRRCLHVFRSVIDPRLEDVGRDTILRDPGLWEDEMRPIYRNLETL